MNLTKPTEIKKLLEENGSKPKKGYGQNFLINKGILDKIVTFSEIKKDDVVVEVGPGLGTLTKEISKKAKQVFVIEKDKKIIPLLKKVLEDEDIKNVEIINDDVLKTDIEKLFKERGVKKYKLVANIPYYITSAIIRKFLEEKQKPGEIILMIQKEVAQRIVNSKKESLLSLSVKFYADPEILFYVSKGSFFPAPKVDSAVIKITPKDKIECDSEKFFKVVKAGFSSPRKLLLGNLKKAGIKIELQKFGLSEKVRAEDLSLSDWISILKN